MPDWSTLAGSLYVTVGSNTAASRGTSINVPGSNNTKGSWSQIVASTGVYAAGITIRLGKNIALSDVLVDIGIGGGGSEVVIAENLIISGRDDVVASYHVPIPIPAGSRLAARCQASSVTSLEVYVSAILAGSPFLAGSPLGRATTYGAVTGDSGGTGIDPGAVAHTKGAWAELAASTTNRIRSLTIGLGTQNNNVMTNGALLLDIGAGPGGSEQTIIENIPAVYSQNEHMLPTTLGPFLVNIPPGTRLAARAQSSITDATDRLFDVIVLGVD